MNIVTLCTGNVARSVMLGYMLTTLAEASGFDWQIRTAGTHVVEGSAMSARTRDALLALDELGENQYGRYRSHQLTREDLAWSDVVLAAEVDHVLFVRGNFPEATAKVVQLYQFVRYAPWDLTLDQQLIVAGSEELNRDLDVPDPAGGDQAAYHSCAQQLWELAQAFAVLAGRDEA